MIVGTGKLMGASDIDSLQLSGTQKQSVYGLRDTLGAGPVFPDPMRPELRPMKVFQSAGDPSASTVREIRCDGLSAACALSRGWVLDLAEVGERVNVEMKLVLGALVFASNVPARDQRDRDDAERRLECHKEKLGDCGALPGEEGHVVQMRDRGRRAGRRPRQRRSSTRWQPRRRWQTPSAARTIMNVFSVFFPRTSPA